MNALKHMVGGGGLGFLLGMLLVCAGSEKFFACVLLALCGGLAAWGLLP